VAELCKCNPFSIGIEQNDNDICNRVAEEQELLKYAMNGNNIVIFSPRRCGKSSLVARVQEDLEKEGFRTIYMDVFSVISETDFMLRFASALYHGLGKGINPNIFMENIGKFFKLLSVELTPEGYKFYTRTRSSISTAQQIEDLLSGMNSYAMKNNLRVHIAFDEFQELVILPQAKKFEGILRSQMQQQHNISYFFVGSRRRVLRDIFFNRSSPFYNSAFNFELKEIPREESASFITSKFVNSGKHCPQEAAVEIYNLVRGFPYYIRKLAAVVWDMSKLNVEISIVRDAFEKLIKAEETEFAATWSGLSLNQKKLLRAIAVEPTSSPYRKDFIAKYDLSVGGTQGAMKVLFDMDIIETYSDDKEKIYRVTDPLIGVWAKRE
jgi:uncharacterized protein